MPNLTKAQLAILAAYIFDAEKETDAKGNLKVALLPPSDGGGAYEVAGINIVFDGPTCGKLKALVEAGNYGAAKALAMAYYITDTADAAGWTDNAMIEAYLRDCVFNRGEHGAGEIIQRAVNDGNNGNLKVDGQPGPKTQAALAAFINSTNAYAALAALRAAREAYERAVAPPIGARAEMWAGLVNRWNSALVMATQFAT